MRLSSEPPSLAAARGNAASSRLVVGARIVILLLAAAAAVLVAVAGGEHAGSAGGSATRYVCPMHPEAVSTTPGDCPICHMALEPSGAVRSHGSSGGGRPRDAAGAEASFSIAEEAAKLQPRDAIYVVRRRVVTQDVLAPAWLEDDGFVAAMVYRDDVAALVPRQRGAFVPAARPGAGAAVRLTDEPPAPWDAQTSRVRFRPDVPGALRRGDVGWVALPATSRDALVVPYDAVLESAQGPYVLIASPDGRTFTRRRVEIGKVSHGMAILVSGLHDLERIVVRDAFLLDAERRLRVEGR